MGRFTTLELADGAGNIPLHEEPRPAGEPIRDAQFYLDEADRHFFRDELEEALQEYSRAVGIDAGAAAAWCGQLFCLIRLEEFREAELWYGSAAGVVGESPELLALRALAAARQGVFDKACGYSDASLEAGGSALAQVVRGELFLYSQRNAAYCFEQACSLPGVEWRIRALIADGCLFSDRREAAGLALQFLLPGIAKYPERGELQMRAARIYLRLNNRKAALAALEAAASLLAGCAPLAGVREEYVRRSGFWQRLFHR